MPRKKKKQKPENELYEIEITDWEIDFHFGVNLSRKLFSGDYSETSCVVLSGKIISPDIKNASTAKIRIYESPALDDHWKNDKESPQHSIGSITVLRDEETLEFFFDVPSRFFSNIIAAAGHEKIKLVLIYGTKLKWRQGTIFWGNFATQKYDEE